MGIMQLFSRRRIYRDLAEEIQQHIEEKTEVLMAEGLSREEAAGAARREFGNVTRIEERGREAWMWPMAESLWSDMRFAFRQLTRNLGFSVTVILTLALGIGATTAIFSLVNAVLLRPLPFPESNRLMAVAQQDHSLPGVVRESLSYPDYFDWRAQDHSLTGMASSSSVGPTVLVHGKSLRVDAQVVSGNLFDVLDVAPVLGRDFNWDDEKPGHRTVMLSYAFWQSEFGSARNVVGDSVVLTGKNYTIVAVMPRDFQYPIEGPAPAMWISLDYQRPATTQRGMNMLTVIGRLKPGVTMAQAQADLTVISGNLARQYPDNNKQYYSALIEPELQRLTGDTRPAFRILFGAVLLVLLIVCANVAGLLLARCSRRSAEFALRTAIGASRAAIVRQLLIESVTLSICGGLGGIALAFGLLRAAVNLMPRDIPRLAQASIDVRVLLFDLAISVATGILFGILPALRMSHSSPANAMRDGSRSLAGSQSRHLLHDVLVIAQTAIGLVLLISSGLLIHSFVRILNVPPGFDPGHVLSARIGIFRPKNEQYLEFFQQALDRVRSVPGVQSVSAGWPLPMSDNHAGVSFNIQGRPVAKGDEPSEALGIAMPGYFATMRIPLFAGRDFTAQDNYQGQPVIIVNRAFADKYFPGENPLGQHIQVRLGDDVMEHPIRQVVGVIGNVKQQGLAAASEPEYFMPFAQAVVTTPYIVIRTDGDPLLLENPLRAVVHDMDPGSPVYRVAPLTDYLSKSAAQPRFQMFVLTCFAGIALVLAAIGLYCLLSYMVAQRTLEIGLRMALGAQRSSVLAMIVRRGLGLAIVGALAGVALSVACTRALSGMLYGIRPSDPVTFAVTSGLMVLTSAFASIIPAWSAARLDPMATLREQ